MNNGKRLAAAALSLALAFAPRAAAAQPGDAPARAKDFRRASKVNAEAPPDRAAFEFEAGGFTYQVSANGHGRRAKGNRVRRFNLWLAGRDFIEGLRFAFHEDDLLLVCELFDGETRAGLVTRLEEPSMRALWRSPVPAAEVGEPLRDGQSLYVTGAAFVGRLDLRTGVYVWEHEDLGVGVGADGGAARSFGGFEKPEPAGDAVLFRERPVYNPPRTLVVDRKTGDIKRIE